MKKVVKLHPPTLVGGFRLGDYKFFKVSLSSQNTIRWECPVCKNIIIRRVSEKTLYSSFVCSYCEHQIEF